MPINSRRFAFGFAFAALGCLAASPAPASALSDVRERIVNLEDQEFEEQSVLDNLNTISASVATGKFVLVQEPDSDFGFAMVSKDKASKWIADQVLTGQMSPDDARALAALTGKRNRQLQNALRQQIARTEANLERIKNQLSALLDERGRLTASGTNTRGNGSPSGSTSWSGQWVKRLDADCYAHDIDIVRGTSTPDDAKCTPQMEGKIAICWNGGSYKNWGSTDPLCAYKDKTPATCTGNPSIGMMYECVKR